MEWLYWLAYFAGAAFLTNANPHFVNGVSGRPFQSPFGQPPGRGLSSSTSNVLWGFFNAVAGYLLLARVGEFDPKNAGHAAAFGVGVLLFGLFLARYFGRYHGGNSPERP